MVNLILVFENVGSPCQLDPAATLISGCSYQSWLLSVTPMKKASKVKVILTAITDKLSNLSGLTK